MKEKINKTMKYFIDTEFHEYHKQIKCLGIKVGKPIPTIDLISIGIVSEIFLPSTNPANGKFGEPTVREYYAISKDFNIKDAWNSHQTVLKNPTKYPLAKARRKGITYIPKYEIVYWIRENVLKSIFKELLMIDGSNNNIVVRKYYKYPTNTKGVNDMIINEICDTAFTLRNFTRLIKKYGKTNKQIAEEIKHFTIDGMGIKAQLNNEIEFYGYYSAYDWVVFAQLFNRMIDLPSAFPMYCNDLKQILDEKYMYQKNIYSHGTRLSNWLKDVKQMPNYPKQSNKHNALDDAKWNKKLYKFLNRL